MSDSRGRATLWEYLKPGSRREPLSRALLPLWRNRVAGNDHKVFKRRLELAGFDARELPRVFGGEGGASARDVASSLVPAVTRAEYPGTSLLGEARRQRNAEILSGILVTIADRYLGADAGVLDETLGRLGVSRLMLVSSLYRRLVWISERLFLHEFKRFKTHRMGRTVRSLLGAFSGEENDRLATEFLEALRDGGLHELSARYPVWCRLIEHEVERWGSVSLELVERLGADRAAIASVFRIDPSDPVVEIQSGGDTHRGGRRVEILTFKSGAKIVYKPRSVCLDVWYAELLTWLSGEPGVSLSLAAPQALDRGTYGWCEFIDHQGTDDPEAITRFYQRTGMLLGLWTVCGGSDGHFENLIARGEHPFMIDTETLFNGYGVERRLRGARGGSASAECLSRLCMSVKRVGLLPEYLKPNEDTDAFDMSAIGARGAWSSPFAWPTQEARDRVSLGMAPEVRPTTLKINAPAPIKGVLGESRIGALERGFEEIYTVLMREKKVFRKRIRNLQKEPAVRVRVVLRSTHLYARLLSETLSPECLRDGVRRSIEIDRLSIKYTKGVRSASVEGVLAAEIAAFESLDIPLFDVPFHTVGRRRVQCSLDGALSATQLGSPSRYVLRRLERMSAVDLRFQRRLIHEILFIDDALKLRSAVGSENRQAPEIVDAVPSIAAIEQMIEEIDRTLRNTAVLGHDGSANWIAPQSVAEGGFYSHGPISAGLWEGSEGVALFYGALYRTTRDVRHREFGLRCIETLHRVLSDSIRRGRIGIGLLSHAYVIERAAELLEVPALRGACDAAIRRANLRSIGRDEKFDVMEGSAGIILGLIASNDALQDEDRLRLMRAAGDHLLNKRILSSSGVRVWQTADAPLAGFAHGMAGIALSLVRLGVLLHESKYIEAAAEAIEYERTLYDPTHGNWADLRNTKKSTKASYVSSAWCHGATGIGLAYLAIQELGASLDLSHDIERARTTTIEHPHALNDTVCCGTFSRISFLDRLERSRGDVRCGSRRDALVSDVLKRSLRGVRTLNLVDHFIPGPGFFNGLSGIGYELIRLYLDRSLPNVHLFEGSSRH